MKSKLSADRSVPATRQPVCANGTALRPAPHPMSRRRAEECNAAAATDISDSFGGDWTNSSTVRGSLHEDPASGSRSSRRSRLLSIESTVVLRRLGAEVDERIYVPMGHTINADELEAANVLLALGRNDRDPITNTRVKPGATRQPDRPHEP